MKTTIISSSIGLEREATLSYRDNSVGLSHVRSAKLCSRRHGDGRIVTRVRVPSSSASGQFAASAFPGSQSSSTRIQRRKGS